MLWICLVFVHFSNVGAVHLAVLVGLFCSFCPQFCTTMNVKATTKCWWRQQLKKAPENILAIFYIYHCEQTIEKCITSHHHYYYSFCSTLLVISVVALFVYVSVFQARRRRKKRNVYKYRRPLYFVMYHIKRCTIVYIISTHDGALSGAQERKQMNELKNKI